MATRASRGAIIVPQKMPVGRAVQELYLAWAASEAKEWVNCIRWLPLSRTPHWKERNQFEAAFVRLLKDLQGVTGQRNPAG